MALEFEIDNIDDLDDSVKALYVPHGDKFRLDVSGIDPADELKSALNKERQDRKDAKQQLADLQAAQVESQRKSDEEKGEFKSLYEREQEDKRSLQERLDSMMKEKRDLALGSATALIGKELSKDTAKADLIAQQSMKFARYNEDGSISYEIGGIQVDKSKVIEQITVEYPFLVDGVKSSGGGANGGDSSGATKRPSEMTSAERLKFKQNDPEGFRKAFNL